MSHRGIVLLLASVWMWTSSSTARGQAGAQNTADATATGSSQTTGQNPGPQTQAKKVWTNDDVSGLRDQSVISTFSTAAAKSSAPGQKGAPNGKGAKWYRANISKLQAKIPPLDDQIADLQAAIDGKPTGNGKESARPRGVKQDSWPVEIDNLKKQRGELTSQIDQLYDDARRSGIAASDLPLQP